jgi:hypothetical protein
MMNSKPYRVHVVVDPLYGEKLRDLPADEPMWVVDTETNRPVIERLRKERCASSNLEGITSFKCGPQVSLEICFTDELPAVDLHHGEFSHNPPYSILNVIGVGLSDKIRTALEEYGFTGYEPAVEGFLTWREIGQPGVGADR